MALNIICPNKDLPEWERLVSDLGSDEAHIAFFRNKNVIPDLETSLDLLGLDKAAWRDVKGRTLYQVQELDKRAKLTKETGAVLPKTAIAPELIPEKPVPLKQGTPAEILNTSKSVSVKVPKGATMLRVTTHYKDRDVKNLITPQELAKGNIFHDAGVIKVEAGRIGLKKMFIPMDGEVTITPKVKQGEIAEATAPETATPDLNLKTVEELRAALPASGLSEPAQNLIRFFLDSPVAKALNGVRYRIADALENGWQGSYFNGLVSLARTCDPLTGPHEFFHRVLEILPPEVKAAFERMRIDEINARLSKPGNYAQIQQLEDLRDNPTSGGQEFTKRGYDRDIYHLSSLDEFFTYSGSQRFNDRYLTATQKGIWQKFLQFARDMIAAVKKYAGLNQSQSEILDNIINGRYELKPEGSVTSEQASGVPENEAANLISSRNWWHVKPMDEKSYSQRGRFYSSSEKESQIYSFLGSSAEQEKISVENPLIGDESFIEKKLLGENLSSKLDPDSKDFYAQRTAIDRRLAVAARYGGYDSIALLSPEGFREFRATGKLPRSIELNTLHDLEGEFKEPIRSPIRWVGGKRQFIPILQKIFEPFQNRRLVEPLFGSGSVTLGLHPKSADVIDINAPLMAFQKLVKDGGKYDLPYKANPTDFAKARDRFNELLRTGKGGTPEAGKLFYYLNQTAHGGLYRVNQKGEFNVSFQADREGRPISEIPNLVDAYKNVAMQTGDYRTLKILPNDFIYSDPPYDSNFQSYNESGFDWKNQVDHAEWLADQGVPTVTQNEATPRIISLYQNLGFDVWKIPARRAISRDAENRVGEEIIATKNIPSNHIEKSLSKTGAEKLNPPQASLPEKEAGESDGLREMQIAGEKYLAPSDAYIALHLSPEQIREGFQRAQQIIISAGLPGERVNRAGGNLVNLNGDDNLDWDGKPARLYDNAVLEKIWKPFLKAANTHDFALSSMLGRFITNNLSEWPKLVSQDVFELITNMATEANSHRAQMLALAKGEGGKDDLEGVVRNLPFCLKRVWSDAFGGDAIEPFIKRLVQNFKDFFTDKELEKIGKSHPNLQNDLDLMAALSKHEDANTLFRRISRRLNPPNIPISKLEKNAMATEEYNSLLELIKNYSESEEGKKSGGAVPDIKKEGLSARQKLLLFVTNNSREKMTMAVKKAIDYGLRQAGIAQAYKEISNANAKLGAPEIEGLLDEKRQEFEAGVDPEPKQIEEALNTIPKYKWLKAAREQYLGYDPITTKLASQIVRGDFRGVPSAKDGISVSKPALPKINLAALAKQPDAEIQRVLNAYLSDVEGSISMEGVSDLTKTRIRGIIENKVLEDLNAVRAGIRERLQAVSKKAGVPKTPQQALDEAINVGLFRDENLLPNTIEKVAAKSLLTKLTPTISQLAKDVILNAPSFRRADIEKQLVDKIMASLPVDDAQAGNLAKAIYKSLDAKMKEATLKAQEMAVHSMTPRELEVMPPKSKQRNKVLEFFRAGGADSGKFLQEFAKSKGWVVPDDRIIEETKNLADQLDKLQYLTDAQYKKIQDDGGLKPEEKATAIKTGNEERAIKNRADIQRIAVKLGARWASFTHPIFGSIRNFLHAAAEFGTANILAKFGFPFRLFYHTSIQHFVRLITRPTTLAWEQMWAAHDANKPVEFWKTLYTDYLGAWTQAAKSIAPGLRQVRAQMAGRGDSKALERLFGGIHALDRAELAAEDEIKKGGVAGYSKAAMLRFIGLFRYSLRVVGALDAFQGEGIELGEIRNQFFLQMANMGKSIGEAQAQWESAFGNMKGEYAQALIDITDDRRANGENPSPKELMEIADRLVRKRMYQKLALFGLPEDSTEAYVTRQRLSEAWQIKPAEGTLGSTVNNMMMELRKFAGPLMPTYFARAIGNGINYHGRLLPWPMNKLFTGAAGTHPTNETPFDRKDNLARSLFGSLFGALAISMILSGKWSVVLRSPTDRKKRDEFIADGHKVGTVEWNHPDGTFTPFSLTVGWASVLSPYMAAAGAVMDNVNKRAVEQAKSDAQADKLGLARSSIPHNYVSDMMGAVAYAAWNTLLGGSTASGLTQSYSEFGTINTGKAISGTVSPVIPLIPMYQELSRIMGVGLDSHLATAFDYLIPLPTSSARMVNSLGDPVRTPNDIQRVVQALTSGTYPGDVDPNSVAKSTAAYAAIFASGFHPPTINPGRGYNFGDTYRPMSEDELSRYTVARGQYLKQELSLLGSSATLPQAKQAYQDAQRRALGSVGATIAPRVRAVTPQTTQIEPQEAGYGGIRVSAPTRTAFRRGRSIRRPRGRKISIRRPRTARARVGHGLGLKPIASIRRPRVGRSLKVRVKRPRLLFA